jgi:hypothetical protein
MSFDERDAARPGISNLTGETGRTKSLFSVNPSIMSEAVTVPLSFWCRFCVVTTEPREARRFMVSPLGCLVQFTHGAVTNVA